MFLCSCVSSTSSQLILRICMLNTCPDSYSPSILLNPPNSPPRIVRNSFPLQFVRFNTRLASTSSQLILRICMLNTCPDSYSPSILLNPPNSPPRIVRNSFPLQFVRFNTRLASMRIRLWFLAVLVLSHALSSTVGYDRGGYGEEGEGEYEGYEWGGEGGGRVGGEDQFLLQNSKRVIQTDAGEMKVVMTYGGRMEDRPMHIGFITMEPQTLFIPQYLDSSLILFVRRGEAKVGSIHQGDLVERRLKMGDVYRISAGSAFYMVNTGEGQRLHIICSIDRSESLGLRTFQSFFIGGGMYPASVLTGFDPDTLATAFNVTTDEIRDFLTRQQEGPIVYVTGNASSYDQPSIWSKFLHLKEEHKLQHLRRMMEFQAEEEGQKKWSWRKLLLSFFEQENPRDGGSNRKWTRGSKGPDSYNLFDRKPDFKNNYGWSVALDESDYEPLRHSGIGVYLVNLTAGSMMAPHVNPTATEYGIVLSGSGTIQIGYPNGSAALNTQIRQGDIFWIPRFFPFCQIASRSAPFEFFGFTTSARRNRPQFLVGQNSMLHALSGPELSASFGISDDEFRTLLDSQREAVILPTASVAPPDEKKDV